MAELTERDRKAINNYLKGMTQQDSLLDAGFPESVARTKSTRFFRREEVQKEIEKKRERMMRKAEVRPEWLMSQLKDIIADPVTKNSDKLRAIELLMKKMGMLRPDDATVNVNIWEEVTKARKRVRRMNSSTQEGNVVNLHD